MKSRRLAKTRAAGTTEAGRRPPWLAVRWALLAVAMVADLAAASLVSPPG